MELAKTNKLQLCDFVELYISSQVELTQYFGISSFKYFIANVSDVETILNVCKSNNNQVFEKDFKELINKLGEGEYTEKCFINNVIMKQTD